MHVDYASATRMAIGPAGKVVTLLCATCTEPTEPADQVGLAEIAGPEGNDKAVITGSVHTQQDTANSLRYIAGNILLSMHDASDHILVTAG